MKRYTVVMLWEPADEVCVECVAARDALTAGSEAQRLMDPEGGDLRVLAVFPGCHQDEWSGE